MFALHTFFDFGQLGHIPFVMKAMVLLKLPGRPYNVFAADPNLGPKGKRPFIVDEGVTVADSALISART
jgi:glutathione S-transferase